MSRIYIDTSALVKVVIREAETPDVKLFLDKSLDNHDELLISRVTFGELYCTLKRVNGIDSSWEDLARTALSNVKTVEVELEDYLNAANANNTLRFADSIHLQIAKRTLCTHMLVFDAELSAAARAVGMTVPTFPVQ